jgi:tricorn protease-like protein
VELEKVHKEVTYIVDMDTSRDRAFSVTHVQSNDYLCAFDPAGLPLFDVIEVTVTPVSQ